ncbi:ABC transporter substrate-binding protein [Gluconacetobacter diazotrophicus]|uniref:D-ribose-binding protein n=3 Tax=Gluconacetobacter diazotrophicus TaxID=33996 RepID=A9HFZ1_GLUDA|nr:ABC transporter substrate-binding protein [Gluconacetobacter diazotrophicus]CAP55429.1 D-ribose-binding protein [Gluconacetobacter diazotrophicus PA1 5]
MRPAHVPPTCHGSARPSRRKILLLAGLLALGSTAAARAEDSVHKIGVTVGSLGNPFFIAAIRGITQQAKALGPTAPVQSVSADYDIGKQASQVDSFIAAGNDLVMFNAVDYQAAAPLVRRLHDSGATVVAFDVGAPGADATITTNNVKAGEISCQYIVDRLHGHGDVVIVNGPPVTALSDRVKGCQSVFAKAPGIRLLSSTLDAKGSRDGGLAVGQSVMVRFDKVDAIFAVNDPTALGVELAARQAGRHDFFLASVDGSPDVEQEMRGGNTLIAATASQDPFAIATTATRIGFDIRAGRIKPGIVRLLAPSLITHDTIGGYKGWNAPHNS